MERIFKSGLLAGLAMFGQSGVNLAYGQASAQGSSPAVAATPQSAGSTSGYPGAPGSSPRKAAYPQGYQPAVGPATASPQSTNAGYGSAGSRIPYPRSWDSFARGNQPMTSQAFMASPQSSPYGGGPPARSVPALAPSYQAYSASGPLGSAQSTTSPSGQFGAAGAESASSPYAGAGSAVPGAGLGFGTGGAGATGTGEGAGTAGGTDTAGRVGTPGDTGTPGGAPGTGAATTSPFAEAGADVLAGLSAQTSSGPPLTPSMIGDLSPFYAQSPASASTGHSPPPVPRPRGAALFFPSVRNFKVSENQSPRPQDRVYFDFNYFNNVNSAINSAEGTQVKNLRAYSYIWGFEKTFDNGNGSIGLRLPLNTLTARSTDGGLARLDIDGGSATSTSSPSTFSSENTGDR